MIGDLLEARALEHDMLSATLEMLTVGVVLTDGTGRSVHANGAASRYLEEGAALYRDQGLIMARDPVAARELAQAIATAASGTTLDIPRAGLVVPLRASRGHDLAAWVLPLDKGMRGDLGADFAAQVAIFLREIGDTSPLPGELFVRRYAITPAECRILMLIVQGMTPQEAAEATGISVNTAKTHIARLFEKTGTQRQAELVRLAMTALAPAQREAPE
jgi:DNA-binding CsgD family transcriptional regulator